MAGRKTQENDGDVAAFLNAIPDERKRRDSQVVLDLMERIVGAPPKMWGDSMVGFGRYHYRYASGHEGDLFLTGFAPRKQALTLYIMPGFSAYDGLMSRLGKHKTGKSCLYVKRLEDIDGAVLEELIERSVAFMRERYGVK